jgi:hypothetical protein
VLSAVAQAKISDSMSLIQPARICGGNGLCVTCKGTGDRTAVTRDSTGMSQRKNYLILAVTAVVLAIADVWRTALFALAAYCIIRAVFSPRRIPN